MACKKTVSFYEKRRSCENLREWVVLQLRFVQRSGIFIVRFEVCFG